MKLWPFISYMLQKRIYFTFQKEKEKLQKAQKKSVFQAFIDKDINSSSGNFTFFTEA
jgi:hypothetical protein